MQEYEWMKAISSTTVCNFFYGFYMVYLIIFVITFASTVYLFMNMKKLGLAGVFLGIQGMIITGVGTTMMLFFYLMCDRSIIEKFETRGWKSSKK
jgi:hypothetical protein